MKRNLIALAFAIGLGAAMSAKADNNTFISLGADTAPDVIIQWNGTGFSVLYNQNNGPFDRIEDTYIGVENTSANGILTSINLTGNSSIGIFAFDGDGQSAYTGVSHDSSGYAGPGTSFSGITTDIHGLLNIGTVNFLGTGLLPGQESWFTLEDNINSPTSGGGGLIVSVPDGGSTMMLLGSAVCGLGMLRRRFAK